MPHSSRLCLSGGFSSNREPPPDFRHCRRCSAPQPFVIPRLRFGDAGDLLFLRVATNHRCSTLRAVIPTGAAASAAQWRDLLLPATRHWQLVSRGRAALQRPAPPTLMVCRPSLLRPSTVCHPSVVRRSGQPGDLLFLRVANMWVPHPFAKQKGGLGRPGTSIDPEPTTIQFRLAERQSLRRSYSRRSPLWP